MEPAVSASDDNNNDNNMETLTTQQSSSRIRRRRSIGSASSSSCSTRNDNQEESRTEHHHHHHPHGPISFLRHGAAAAGIGLSDNISGHSATISNPSGHSRGSAALSSVTGHSSIVQSITSGHTSSSPAQHSRRSSNQSYTSSHSHSSYTSQHSSHTSGNNSHTGSQMSGNSSHHASQRSSNRSRGDDDDDDDGEQSSSSRCSDSRTTSASSKKQQQHRQSGNNNNNSSRMDNVRRNDTRAMMSSAHQNQKHLQPLSQLEEQQGRNNDDQQLPLVPHVQQQQQEAAMIHADYDDGFDNDNNNDNKRSFRDKLMKELKTLPSQRFWDDDMTFSRPSSIFRRIRLWCGYFVNLAISQIIIILLIVINALMMGVGTFDFVTEDPEVSHVFEQIDQAFLCVFTVEIVLHLVYRCLSFFSDAWLIFDMFIVVFSWSLQSMQIIRAFRIFRALRLVTRINSLRELVVAIGAVMPRMYAITLLLLLMFYIFAVLFTELFSDLVLLSEPPSSNPNPYFGTLDQSLFTCMSLMTLEWADVARDVMEQRSWAWAPFTAFISLSGFIVFNLIVAVVCDAVKTTVDEEYAAQHPGQYRNHDYRFRGGSTGSILMEDEMSRQRSVSGHDSFALEAAREENDSDDANLMALVETQERVWEVSENIKTLSERQTELQGIVAELGEELRLLQKCAPNPTAQPLPPSTIHDSITTSSSSSAKRTSSIAKRGDDQKAATFSTPLKNDNPALSRLGKTRGGWHFPSPHESPDSSSGKQLRQEQQQLHNRSSKRPAKIDAPPLTSTIESAQQRLAGRPSSLVGNRVCPKLPAAAERQRRLELHADNSNSNHSSDHRDNNNNRLQFAEVAESSFSLGGSQADNDCRGNAIYSVTLGLLPQLLEDSRSSEVSSFVSSTGTGDDDDDESGSSPSSATITSYTESHSWLDDVPTLATATSPEQIKTIDHHHSTTNTKSNSGDSNQDEQQQEQHDSFSRNTYSSGSETDLLLLENSCNMEEQILQETNVDHQRTEFPLDPSESTENTETARYFF